MTGYARDMRPAAAAATTNDKQLRGPHAVRDCRYFCNSPRFPGDHFKDVVPAGFPDISFYKFFISVRRLGGYMYCNLKNYAPVQ